MTTKDTKQKTKTSLMDELKSIKGVLDTDDDNVPLLLDDKIADDDDIPVLAAEDDVPVLTSPDDFNLKANQASLDASIRELESMEFSSKPRKPQPEKANSLEEKIRNNAAPPLFDDHNATTVRENPFLKKPNDRFTESRKQAEAALQSVIAHSRAISQPSRMPPPIEEKTTHTTITDHPSDSPIDFTDNQFLKASSAPVPVATASTTPVPAAAPAINKNPKVAPVAEKTDGSDDILKLLNEDVEVDLDLGDDFGELVDIDVDALIAESSPPKSSPSRQPASKPAAGPAKQNTRPAPSTYTESGDKLNQLVNEVIDEYLVVLEAALKKKLKTQLNQMVDEVSDEYLVILETALKKKLKEK